MSGDRAALGARLSAFASGLLFGGGLVIGGMTQPDKVLGFLDLFGAWDPSLMFVMAGAIAVHFLAYRVASGRSSPLLAPRFELPERRGLDRKLLAGAALFGVGWGLGGYCPGPGVVSLASGHGHVLAFVAALLAGLYGTARIERAM